MSPGRRLCGLRLLSRQQRILLSGMRRQIHTFPPDAEKEACSSSGLGFTCPSGFLIAVAEPSGLISCLTLRVDP